MEVRASGSSATPRESARWQRAPWAVLACAILYTCYLLAQVPWGAFYSGDSGLKFLMVRQFASGRLSDVLALRSEPWIEELWNQGLYPFGEPFVYALERGRVVAFPQLFMLLTALFYRVLGYAGLYVLPAASVWAIWWRFVVVARRRDVSEVVTAAGLAVLAFATPLTLYAAIFWEHTLGCLLALLGVEFLLTPANGTSAALGRGLLSGLGPWIRSESLCLIGALLFVCAASPELRRRKGVGWFLAGLVASTAALIVSNVVLYQHPFGVHALQVVEPHKARDVLQFYRLLLLALLATAPVTAFLLVVPFLGRGRPAGIGGVTSLWCVIVLFLALVPWVVPNVGGKQLGPRYLLLCLPPVCLLATLVLAEFARSPGWRARAAGALLALALATGGYVNTILGTEKLVSDYRSRVLVERVREDESALIAVANHFISQELAVLLDTKTLFLVPDKAELALLCSRALEHGYTSFLLIVRAGTHLPQRMEFDGGGASDSEAVLRPLGKHGNHDLHRVVLTGA